MARWTAHRVVVPAPPPLGWAASHAALPVVLPGSDTRLRLFLSSRDALGRSQVASGWFDTEYGSASFDDDVAVPIGTAGTFDDRGATSSCAVIDDYRVLLYYTGWNVGVTVPFYLEIGCAVSTDGGATFAKVATGPVLGRTRRDPILTASPSVLVEDGVWRMWYVSGTGWAVVDGTARPRYHIRYAESSDGVAWQPTGRVCIDYRNASETAIARPCVLRDADRYRMWFCARGTSYSLGYAESADGLVWERRDEDSGFEPSGNGWDADMQAYPFVFDHGGRRHMLYNGNGFGETGVGHAILR